MHYFMQYSFAYSFCALRREGKEKPVAVDPESLEGYLSGIQASDSTMYIALHADEDVAYKEVVRVLDIANEHHMKLVVATKRQ